MRHANHKKTINEESSVKVQNYPNPFNGITTIEAELPIDESSYNLMITNMIGQILKIIKLHGGINKYTINAGEMKAGIYFYSLTKNAVLLTTKKMICTE